MDQYPWCLKMQCIFALLCFLIFNSGQATDFTPTCYDTPESDAAPLNISPDDLNQALDYGRSQRSVRIANEDAYVGAGHSISKTDVSSPARSFTPVTPQGLALHRCRLEYEDATSWLAKKYNLNAYQVSEQLSKTKLPQNNQVVQECQNLQKTSPCDENAKYRTFDGTCNNLKNPNWGSASSCFRKILNPSYDDKVSTPRSHEGSSALPNPRHISTTVSPDLDVTSQDVTQMIFSFGQFIAHDTVLSAIIVSGKNGDLPNCCPVQDSPDYCISIDIPEDDPYFRTENRTCINTVRALACINDCSLGTARLQVNGNPSFTDASHIYGSSKEDADALRTMKGGALKNQENQYGEYLPKSFNPNGDQCSKTLTNNACFQAGDPRSSAHPGLTSMHTIFLRMHNRIAKLISKDYPEKTDEELYQQTRRIIAATIESNLYQDFYPVLLGPEVMKHFQLNVLNDGYTTYNPDLNPSAYSEYASAATRYGHTTIQKDFQMYAENNVKETDLPIEDAVLHPQCFYDGKMDSVVRGLYHQGEQQFDRHLINYMTDHLFEVKGNKDGGDIMATNIQRGRDLGVPSYTKILKYCFNITASSFDDLNVTMNKESVDALRKTYKKVEDIDLFPGGVSERPLDKTVLGPTFACIIGKQFHNIKFGDRFYFEHKDQAGSFTEGQLKELRKTSLSQIICQHTGLKKITPNVFRTISESNQQVNCTSLQGPDFSKWFDKM